MGHPLTVSVWMQITQSTWAYRERYAGNNMLAALWAMWQMKRIGHTCIKLEWRPYS